MARTFNSIERRMAKVATWIHNPVIACCCAYTIRRWVDGVERAEKFSVAIQLISILFV